MAEVEGLAARCEGCMMFHWPDNLIEGLCINCEPMADCYTCRGTGEGMSCSSRCSSCGGSGAIRREK